MSNEVLTKALRRLSVGKCTDPKCWEGCAVYNECLAQVVNDAADCIEKLEAELADLNEMLDELYGPDWRNH